MKKINRSEWTGLFIGIGVFLFSMGGISQNAFARLTCNAQWETNEGTPHCHLSIQDSNTGKEQNLCSNTIVFEELKTPEACETYCTGSDPLATSDKLGSLLFSTTDKILNIALLLKTETQMSNQIAGQACLKAEKLQMLLKQIMDKLNKGNDNDPNSESFDPSKRPIPPGMYY